jgi:hypothetical protein
MRSKGEVIRFASLVLIGSQVDEYDTVVHQHENSVGDCECHRQKVDHSVVVFKVLEKV